MKVLNEYFEYTYIFSGICPKCKKLCNVYERDDGYWTDRGWYSVYFWYSNCCGAEINDEDIVVDKELTY